MNILYVSPMTIDRNSLDGVARKLLAQCDAFRSYPEVDQVYLASYFEEGKYLVINGNQEYRITYTSRSSRQLELMEIYGKIAPICRELKIDAVYFRISALSMASNALFRALHSRGIRLIVEIPTYPFWKEKWMDVRDKLLSGKIATACKRSLINLMYFYYSKQLKKYAQAIVTFSDIRQLWGIPVIGIANGYEFRKQDHQKPVKKQGQPLNLLMVASIRDNHGADRIISGMTACKNQMLSHPVVFHIVGDGEVVPTLRQQARAAGLEEQVLFHGFLSGKPLEEMYTLADVGVSALGFHRLGVHYASPLKSKEYFAKGIPVLGTTVEHDILASNCKAFYYAMPQDDTPVDIGAVCSFYDQLMETENISEQIITTAERTFSWVAIMRPVYEKFASSMKG